MPLDDRERGGYGDCFEGDEADDEDDPDRQTAQVRPEEPGYTLGATAGDTTGVTIDAL
jgi:hypothetical protein